MADSSSSAGAPAHATSPQLSLTVEFSGGLEMLFSHQRSHTLTIPAADKDGRASTIAYLIDYLCDHVMDDSRKDLFVLDNHLVSAQSARCVAGGHMVLPSFQVRAQQARWAKPAPRRVEWLEELHAAHPESRFRGSCIHWLGRTGRGCLVQEKQVLVQFQKQSTSLITARIQCLQERRCFALPPPIPPSRCTVP
ncbi:ubiquitin-like modifier 1 [Ilyonectria robusta]